MYSLTLTFEERKALDWIGNRYFHGDELADILTSCMGDDEELPVEGDYTFQIPEHKAWEIYDGFLGDDMRFDCLSDDLARKFLDFCDRIV